MAALSSPSSPLPSPPLVDPNSNEAVGHLPADDENSVALAPPPQDRGRPRTPPSVTGYMYPLANSPGTAAAAAAVTNPSRSSVSTSSTVSGNQPSKTGAGPLSPSKGYSANASRGGAGGVAAAVDGGQPGAGRGVSAAWALHGRIPGPHGNPCSASAAAAAAAASPTPAGRASGGGEAMIMASPLSSRGAGTVVPPASPMSPFHVFAGTQLSPLSRSNHSIRGGGKSFSFLLISEEQGDDACDDDDDGGDGGGDGDDDAAAAAGGDRVGVAASIGGGQTGERGAGGTPSDVAARNGQAWWVGYRGPEPQQRLDDDSFDPTWALGSSILPLPQQPALALAPDVEQGGVGGGVGGFDDGDAEAGGVTHRQAQLVSLHSINPAATATSLRKGVLVFPSLQSCGRTQAGGDGDGGGGLGGGGGGGDAGNEKPGARQKKQGFAKNAKKKQQRSQQVQHHSQQSQQAQQAQPAQQPAKQPALQMQQKKSTKSKTGVSSSSGSSSRSTITSAATTTTASNHTKEGSTYTIQQQHRQLQPVLSSSPPATTPAFSAAAPAPGVGSGGSSVSSEAVGTPLPPVYGTITTTTGGGGAAAARAGGGDKTVVYSGVDRSSSARGSAAALQNVHGGVVATSAQEQPGGGGVGTAPQEAAAAATTTFDGWNHSRVRVGEEGGVGMATTAAEAALAATDILMSSSSSMPPLPEFYGDSPIASTAAAAAAAAVTTAAAIPATMTTPPIGVAGSASWLMSGEEFFPSQAAGGPGPAPAPAARGQDQGASSSLMLSSFSLSPVLAPRQRDDSFSASLTQSTALALTPAPSRRRQVTTAAAAAAAAAAFATAAAAASSSSTAAANWYARNPHQSQHAVACTTSDVRPNPRPFGAGAGGEAGDEFDSYDGGGGSGIKLGGHGGDSELVQSATRRLQDGRSVEVAGVGAPARKRRRAGFDGSGMDCGIDGSAGLAQGDAKARASGGGRGGGGGERPRPLGEALTGEMLLGSPADGSVDGGDGDGGNDTGNVGQAARAVPSSAGRRRNNQAGAVMVDARPSPTGPGRAWDAMEQQTNHPCTCKKCKCLKLYCDCFAQSRFCGPACLCVSCNNRYDGATLLAARRSTLHRNPKAFTRVLALERAPETVLEGAGCGCTKSQCLKRYCVCFQKGLRCGRACSCEGCMNTVGSRGPARATEADSTTPLPQPPRNAGSVSRAGFDAGAGGVMAPHASEGLFTPPPHR